ncbi:uncharacterized protein LOC120347508 isoform X2 [Styela clava]
MSMFNRDEAFICALKKNPNQRTNKDLEIIFSRLHRFEALSNLREQGLKKLCAEVRYEWHDSNEILYGKDDPCTCWFILLSGSIFIQGSMFLRNTSFGKRIPGTTSRGCQCLVLEPSEMIAIDYPEMHPPLHTVRVPDLRNHSTSSKSTLDSVAEANSSSVESSPKQNVSRKSSGTMANGQVQTDNTSDISKDSREYYINQEDSRSQDDPEQDDEDFLEEQEDSISLHSSSSFVIKDLVTDVLKKDISERNEDDHDVLLEFTRSLQAFSNMTEPTRRELCKVMVFAHVDKAGTELLKDNEALDSWSVIINGQVQIVYPDSDENNDTLLYMGESFGVTPSMQTQYHKGTMYTMVDDCQFLCIAQEDYCNVLHQGKENMENIMGEDGVVEMVKEKREIEGGRKGHIVIRGTPETLRAHLLEENSIDTTYAEDYLLTYRAFSNEPIKICNQLLEWFDREEFQAKVTRVILLWVNNHFNDFERDRHMMNLLEKFEEKLQTCNKTGQCKLFNIACSTKAKSKIITLSRSSNEEDLGFSITGGTDGYPIYILKVTANSVAEEKGLKRGDQLLNVNGQNFEKLNMERANAILRKNTDLTLTVKTNLFAFKEMMADIKNPQKKREKAKKGKHENTPVIAQILTMQPTKASRMPSITSEAEAYDGKTKKASIGNIGTVAVTRMRKLSLAITRMPVLPLVNYRKFSETDAVAKDDSFLSALKNTKYQPGSAATVDGPRSFRQAAAHSSSNPDLLDPGCYVGVENPSLAEVPEDVIKVFRADQTYRFVFVNQDTTAEEAVRAACKEFGIAADSSKNYSLCRVTVQNETFVKQSKLPDTWSKLSEIPLSARYYLKNNMESEQLLPDENIPELLKEANYTFLDLNCFEVALHLTLQDYERFKTVEQTDFIDDLFHLNEESLTNFKSFEDLVNRELFWVVSTLCLEPNLLRRSKMLKHFTKIAHHCKALKNLNSTFAIISGLGYRAVSRMKASWEKVPAKVQRTFDDLQSLMDPSRNMSKYRTLLNELAAQPPALPYIPVVKKDLTFLHLGNDTKVDDLVNFEKMRMIGREVRNVCRLCSADSSQIISSAIAHNHEADRPSSNIYHTLTRKGRRSSFNNARKMYEDAVNARRVKQYMQQLDIEKDEDKLMEMSKQVEPSSVSSAQTKRRNAGSADSPSRSSKTLPGGQGLSANAAKRSQGRNNSEPQIPVVPGMITQQNARKKNPVSSFPKFGTTSPQAIRKLLALSEESGDGGSSGSSKRGSLEQRRSGSASSRELSPATSPYLSPRRDRDVTRSKGSISSSDSGHSVAHENSNRNNNKGRHDLSSSVSRASIQSKHLSHPPALASHSNSSSARSSIASSSSLGISSTSLNAPGLSSSSSSHSLSPRSSPNHIMASRGTHSNKSHHSTFRNSPVRSSSSSSADTIKSTGHGRPVSDRPVIMQGRSGSFGALSVTTVKSERLIPPGSSERKMTGSSSSPSLSVRAAASQHHLILPNQFNPQLPRSPSMDSGVVSMGSLSADSTRFLNSDPGEIFQRPAHRSTVSLLSSEGFASQQSLQHIQGEGNSQSPVMRRHLRNMQHKQDDASKGNSRLSEGADGCVSATTQRIVPGGPGATPPRVTTSQTENEGTDDIKQTFLSGSRGWGDAPLMRDKDPWPIEAMMPPGVAMPPLSWSSQSPADNMSSVGPNRSEFPRNQSQKTIPNSPLSREFKGGGGDSVDGTMQYSPKKRAVSGTGAEIQQYYERLRLQERPNPPSTLNFRMGPSRSCDSKTPEAILEEKLLLELQQQKPRLNKSFDSASSSVYYQSRNGRNQAPLCERHSASFGGLPPGYHDSSSTPGTPVSSNLPMMHQLSLDSSDPSIRNSGMKGNFPSEYSNYPCSGNVCTKPGCKCPASRSIQEQPNSAAIKRGFEFTSPGRTSSPKQNALPPDMRGKVPFRREGENMYMSDFGNPDPRTFVRARPDQGMYPNRDNIRLSEEDNVSGPFHCPKHGSPYINQHAGAHYKTSSPQAFHGLPEFSSLPLPPPLSGTPDAPEMHYRVDPRYNYRHQNHMNDISEKHVIAHTRSSSDISLHSSGYEFADSNTQNTSLKSIDNGQMYPSPIDSYVDSPRLKGGYYRDSPNETPQSLQTSRNSLSNVSINSTPKLHNSSANPPVRRKSSEWAVTDLDKENNQQAMQVWTSSSSSTINASNDSSIGGKSNTSTPSKDQPPPTQTVQKRKKPPPPLPPQRNSSYGATRQLRLSSSTLSPLSSPPNSPTTPMAMMKISLSETHPQLVVKTMVNGPNLNSSDVPQTTRSKPLVQSNGVVPNMTQSNMIRKDTSFHSESSFTSGRTLPSYNEAMNHISLQSSFSPSNSNLPSYQNYQDMRETKEQTSQV